MAESETLIHTPEADTRRKHLSEVRANMTRGECETVPANSQEPPLSNADLTEITGMLVESVERLSSQVTNLVELNRRLIAANIEIRKKLIELEGDMIKPEQRSALILPDHMRGN